MNPIANLSTTQNVNRPQTAQGYNNRPYFGNEEAVSDEVMLSSTPQEDEAAAKKRKMWTIGGAILGTLAIAIGVASGIGTAGKLSKKENLKGLSEAGKEIFTKVEAEGDKPAQEAIKLGNGTQIALNSKNFFSNGLAWGGGTYNSRAYAVKDALGSKKTMYYVGSEDNFKKLQEALEKTYEKKEDAPTIEHFKINDKTTEWKDLEDATAESIADKLKGENNFVLFGTEASNLFDGIQSSDRDSCKKLIEAWENKSAPAADPANTKETSESNGTGAAEAEAEAEAKAKAEAEAKAKAEAEAKAKAEAEHTQSIIKISAGGEIFKKVPATDDNSELPAITLGKGTQVALNPQNENLSAVKDALGSKNLCYVGSTDNFNKFQEELKKIYKEKEEDAPTIELIDITNKSPKWGELEDTTVESIADKLKGENNFVLFGTEASSLLDEINSNDNRKLCDKLIKAFENEKKNKLNNESVANDGNDDKEDLLKFPFVSQSPTTQEDEDLAPLLSPSEDEDLLPLHEDVTNNSDVSRDWCSNYDFTKGIDFNKFLDKPINSQQPTHQTQDESKMSEDKVAKEQTQPTTTTTTITKLLYYPIDILVNGVCKIWDNVKSNNPVDDDDDPPCI